MPSKQVERKYQLTKLEAGDYLLPGNDGETIWRVARYDEEHIAPDGLTIEYRKAWGVWKWTRSGPPEDIADLEFACWDMHAGPLDSRAEAIQAALRSELPKPKPKKSKRTLDDAIRSMISPDSSEGGRG